VNQTECYYFVMYVVIFSTKQTTGFESVQIDVLLLVYQFNYLLLFKDWYVNCRLVSCYRQHTCSVCFLGGY